MQSGMKIGLLRRAAPLEGRRAAPLEGQREAPLEEARLLRMEQDSAPSRQLQEGAR